jgi:transcriptional regulator with XRE-family HTH domain
MNLGEKILKLRKANGLSQEELASQLTISRQAISKWELGESVPDTENVLQLSRLFGVSTDFLLDDSYDIDHDTCLGELSKGTQEADDGSTAKGNSQSEAQKPPLALDIIFVIVAVLAAWSIMQIPALIGHSVLGFLTITLQVMAVMYVPIYLLLLRPRKVKYVYAKKVMVCTATGYVISFIVGIVFNYEYDFIVDGVVQSRNYTAWQIWTISFLAITLVGIIWEVVSRHRIISKRVEE